MKTLRKLTIFGIGTLLLLPCLLCCTEDFAEMIFGVLYCVTMYILRKNYAPFRKLWRDYVKLFDVSDTLKRYAEKYNK